MALGFFLFVGFAEEKERTQSSVPHRCPPTHRTAHANPKPHESRHLQWGPSAGANAIAPPMYEKMRAASSRANMSRTMARVSTPVAQPPRAATTRKAIRCSMVSATAQAKTGRRKTQSVRSPSAACGQSGPRSAHKNKVPIDSPHHEGAEGELGLRNRGPEVHSNARKRRQIEVRRRRPEGHKHRQQYNYCGESCFFGP